jgi:hypothetical protein
MIVNCQEARRKQEQLDKELEKKRREEAELRSYKHLFNEAAMMPLDVKEKTVDASGGKI